MKLKYAMEVIEIDGALAAVPIGDGDEFRGVLHMNATTGDILAVLKDDVTEDEIVAALQQQYAATETDIRRNVQKVLGILREYALLVE